MQYRNQELLKVEIEKRLYQENLKIVNSLKCKHYDIFDLDIGGTHRISTTKNTLTKVN